ncbi:hypothetical protein [Streptomyces pini]|uniref:hypothetical protein n=1 Tax=Streptomyces pini TaxID=1520580 RepID=UPI000B86FEBF|nr:hypothetical protein [Streptomyces pini]
MSGRRGPGGSVSAGRAEVRTVAASPEAARRVAEVLRSRFAAEEQRGHPAHSEGGTGLHLTVDTTRPAGSAPSRLVTGQASGNGHDRTDEAREGVRPRPVCRPSGMPM